jgi:hypothetical protein
MVYNKTSGKPQLVLLKKGKRGMSLDAYRVRYPDGTFLKDKVTGRPALFARNAKDWNAMQANVYGMRGSYSMDPSEDPESKLAENLAKNVEQGAAIAGAAGSIAIAPFLATAGDIAGQTLVRSGAGAALDSAATGARTAASTGSRAVTSTLQQGLNTIRGATGQTLTQRAGTTVGIEMVGTRGVAQAAAADTLGTTAAQATSLTGGRVTQGAFLSALAASRASTHQKLEKHFERDTGATYEHDNVAGGTMRRPIVPPPEPRTVPKDSPSSTAAKVKSRSGRFIIGTRESRAPIITLDDMRASVEAEHAQTRSGARLPTVRDMYLSRGQQVPGVAGMFTITQRDREYMGNPPGQTSTTPVP